MSPAVLPILAADLGDLIQLLFLLLILFGGAIKSALDRSKAHRAAEAEGEEADEGTEVVEGAEEAPPVVPAPLSRPAPASRPAPPSRPAPASRPAPPSRPTAARAPAPSRPRERRRGLVEDAHVELSARLPTADDMPGAHAAHDHIGLTEIGRDPGSGRARSGAKPTGPAPAPHETRRAPAGRSLLYAKDLPPLDRVRAGFLWGEVFAPPRGLRDRGRRSAR